MSGATPIKIAGRMRVMTMLRWKALKGTRGWAPNMPMSWWQRESMGASTMTHFAPMYQKFVSEYAAFEQLTPAQITQAIDLLAKPRTHDAGLETELNAIHPNLSQMLRSILLTQYSRGEMGIVTNLVALDDAGFFQRMNRLGFGKNMRNEMLTILQNAEFFKDIKVDIDEKTKEIKVCKASNNSGLVTAKVDDAKHQLILTPDPTVAPQDRPQAIAQLLMLAACHAQQNDSNVFLPVFGDDIEENLLLLRLAVGTYNLHIPGHVIANYNAKIQTQLNAITDPTKKDQLQKQWDFWSANTQIFSHKLSTNGSPRIDIQFRPHDDNNKLVYAVQDWLLQKIQEDNNSNTAPAQQPPSRPAGPS